VRAFPTLLLERNGDRTPLAVGAVKADALLAQLRQAIAN
jgi:protein-disulfide isomerase-like protein with CxxC motif